MTKFLTVLTFVVAGSVAHAEDPLETTAVAQAQLQGAKGAARVGDVYRGAGAKTDYQILLEGNTCYWFSGASEGLKKLYMYLWTPNAGAFTPRVADLRSPGQGTMAYCTQQAGMYKFQVKTEGPGRFLVVVFTKEAPKQAPPAEVVVKQGPNLGPICDRNASAAAPGAKRQGEFFEGAGNAIGHEDRVDYPVQFDAGKCYWVVACGEPERVKTISLYLWGPDNKRITEAKSDTPNPMLGHCAKETGMFKFQAKITGGSGHFKAAVYRK